MYEILRGNPVEQGIYAFNKMNDGTVKQVLIGAGFSCRGEG
jgi:hypothetical protein